MKRSGGFTLVEMVVVLAVVAILAAILVPTVAKNINDAKIARAGNEAQVIGAAIASFYKDLGRWPDADGATAALAGAQNVLRTADGTMPTIQGGTGGWAGAAWDTYENHLLRNTPGDQGVAGANTYATVGELRWNGPYLTDIKSDPWGSNYLSNVDYLRDGTINAVWVISAGSDRTIRTDFTQALAANPGPELNNEAGAAAADDVGFRIQ